MNDRSGAEITLRRRFVFCAPFLSLQTACARGIIKMQSIIAVLPRGPSVGRTVEEGMKNLFGVNWQTGETDNEKFVIRRVGSALSRKQEEAEEQIVGANKSANLPAWLLIVLYVCGGYALIVVVQVVFGLSETPFTEMYNNAPWVFYSGGACLVVAVALFIYARLKHKKVVENPGVQTLLEDYEKTISKSYEDLRVPAESDSIDVFSYGYKIKNGKVRDGSGFAKYAVVAVKIFKENDMLCFADTSTVTAIPLSSIQGVFKINKNATFMNWTKEEAHNKGRFKPYKIRVNNYGTYFIKPYYSVRVVLSGEEYEIVLPGYELEVFLSYANVGVTEA